MSLRVFTNGDDERIVDRVLKDLTRDRPDNEIAGLYKWHVLRLALALSFREPFPHGVPDSGRRTGAEYRVDQLTGKGKRDEDFTTSTRALLSVQHQVDLFDSEEGDSRLQQLLEYHLSRGLTAIQQRWLPEERFAAFLLRELSQGISSEPEMEAPQPLDRLRGALSEIGVAAEPLPSIIHGPRLTRYTLRLPRLSDLDVLRKGLDKLAFALGYPPGSLSYEQLQGEERQVALDLPRSPESWRRYGGDDLRSWCRDAPREQELPLCPGVDSLGRPFWFDLSRAAHVLVGGTTGSGKSTAVHTLLCSLLLGPRADLVDLVLIDPKQVELGLYKTLPNLWQWPNPSGGDRVEELLLNAGVGKGRLLVESAEIDEALNQLIAEMDRRYTQIQLAGARDILEARSRLPEPLKWIVVVVEELADLVLVSPRSQDLLIRLVQKGRAAGIHVLVATQRPDAETFRGLLRSNLPTRLALAVQRASESRIILDEEGAERLLKPGDMLYKEAGQRPIRLHGVAMSQAAVQQVARQLRRGVS